MGNHTDRHDPLAGLIHINTLRAALGFSINGGSGAGTHERWCEIYGIKVAGTMRSGRGNVVFITRGEYERVLAGFKSQRSEWAKKMARLLRRGAIVRASKLARARAATTAPDAKIEPVATPEVVLESAPESAAPAPETDLTSRLARLEATNRVLAQQVQRLVQLWEPTANG